MKIGPILKCTVIKTDGTRYQKWLCVDDETGKLVFRSKPPSELAPELRKYLGLPTLELAE